MTVVIGLCAIAFGLWFAWLVNRDLARRRWDELSPEERRQVADALVDYGDTRP